MSGSVKCSTETISDRMTIDPAVKAYYERRPEEDRLLAGPSQLEAARTRRLIERHAPNPPATVLDALWMAEKGYSVHLVDPVERLVEEARRRSARAAQPINTCRVGTCESFHVGSGFCLMVRPDEWPGTVTEVEGMP